MEKFSGSHIDAKSTIESAFVHVQTYYCHLSLGTQLQVDRIGDIMHIDDNFPTHELYSSKVLAYTKQIIGTADLMVYINGESICQSNGCLLGIGETENMYSMYVRPRSPMPATENNSMFFSSFHLERVISDNFCLLF